MLTIDRDTVVKMHQLLTVSECKVGVMNVLARTPNYSASGALIGAAVIGLKAMGFNETDAAELVTLGGANLQSEKPSEQESSSRR